MASTTYLQRTVSTTGSRRKATFSGWFKRSNQVEAWFLNSGGNYSTGYNTKIGFGGNNEIFILNASSSTTLRYQTKRRLRDTSAWYHIVVAFDTENSTSADRVKIYINGNRETLFTSETVPSLNLDLEMNQNTSSKNLMAIGGRYNTGDLFDGIMSHVHWCDGTAYDASAFGSTDSTTGEWKIITSPSVTYGTNGFFILKDDNAVTDRSGQGNNFTVGGGTLTKTEDCPSNNFPTLMSYEAYGANTLIDDRTNGNTVGRSTTSGYSNYFASMAAYKGKYYWEFKYLAGSANNINIGGGIRWADTLKGMGVDAYQTSAGAWIVSYDGQKFNTVGSKSSANFTNAQSNNDICHIAWNATIGAWWFGVNGTWASSATDSEIAAGTVTNAVYSSLDTTRPYAPCCFDAHTTSNTHDFAFNFGNGYFATTAVASAGTNASGIGIFEFDVPAGFTALSTKGLNL